MCGPCVLEAAAHGLTSSTAVPSTRSAPPSSSSSPRTPGRVGLQPGRLGLQPGEVGLQQRRSVGVVAHAAQFDEREAERAGSVRRPAREEPRSLAAEPRGVHLGLDCLEAEAVRGRDACMGGRHSLCCTGLQPLLHTVAASGAQAVAASELQHAHLATVAVEDPQQPHVREVLEPFERVAGVGAAAHAQPRARRAGKPRLSWRPVLLKEARLDVADGREAVSGAATAAAAAAAAAAAWRGCQGQLVVEAAEVTRHVASQLVQAAMELAALSLRRSGSREDLSLRRLRLCADLTGDRGWLPPHSKRGVAK